MSANSIYLLTFVYIQGVLNFVTESETKKVGIHDSLSLAFNQFLLNQFPWRSGGTRLTHESPTRRGGLAVAIIPRLMVLASIIFIYLLYDLYGTQIIYVRNEVGTTERSKSHLVCKLPRYMDLEVKINKESKNGVFSKS